MRICNTAWRDEYGIRNTAPDGNLVGGRGRPAMDGRHAKRIRLSRMGGGKLSTPCRGTAALTATDPAPTAARPRDLRQGY